MELSIQERLKDLRVERGLTLEQLGIVNKCAVEEYPKSQAAIPPVPPVRIFDGGSPCGLKLFTRMVL